VGIGRRTNKMTNTEEFVIWGIRPGESDSEVLFTRARTLTEATRVLHILTSKHGITNGRIQTLDLNEDLSKVWGSGELLAGNDGQRTGEKNDRR
jgi:hypothetical protein